MNIPATTTAPIVKLVDLDCPVDRAVEVFFDRIGEWWPLQTHHVTDQPRTVRFPREVHGVITEVGAQPGDVGRWGQVLVWQPPERVVWTWEVSTRNPPTEVEVRFTELDGDRCQLRLEHRGWEAFTDPDARREALGRYTPGWDAVLAGYVVLAGA